jgi:hypothetical protein
MDRIVRRGPEPNLCDLTHSSINLSGSGFNPRLAPRGAFQPTMINPPIVPGSVAVFPGGSRKAGTIDFDLLS